MYKQHLKERKWKMAIQTEVLCVFVSASPTVSVSSDSAFR